MELDNDDYLWFKAMINKISSASASLLHCWVFGPLTKKEMKSYKMFGQGFLQQKRFSCHFDNLNLIQ